MKPMMTRSGAPYHELLSDENASLLQILAKTSGETGDEFFRALVRELASTLNTCGALVADYLPDTATLRPRAYWLSGQWVEPVPYEVAGTPCEGVIRSGRLFQIPDRVIDHYPKNPFLREYDLVSYTGMPFKDAAGRIIGHLAVLDTKPVPDEARYRALFEIFGTRAAAEMARLQAEEALRGREEQLRQLVEGALDAIIEFDEQYRIRFANPSARSLFAGDREAPVAAALRDWLSDDSLRLLRDTITRLSAVRGQRQSWVGRRLKGLRPGGKPFDIEATLSQALRHGQLFHTLILRDAEALSRAERQIDRLQRQTDSLRDELSALQGGGHIIGSSLPFRAALGQVTQVAPTDATVLLLGETGSGKEVFARAIHQTSPRAARPLVAVNCAAIPRDLVESEFFGHARGAFTGATDRRDGRFLRADGGTIFLDEVGELPLEVQAKLLRVLQEGEFEPVGGARPLRVDVRVIAASNRRLVEEVQGGRFREDLYYRLSAFPIEVPPLRERGADILLLAEHFAERAAARFGRPPRPIDPQHANRLLRHRWPGNVRELQNIIEHAVITSQDGVLRPEVSVHAVATADAPHPRPLVSPILTALELRDLQRQNILRALAASAGRVSGPQGAAVRLGLQASTLR
ncbi:MAG: sigma 54-interacting transcriptional regulator, partial [Rubrivivax sp.]|nr:sigma 54-interacting transcriptional regulator [Rubrivivax sp.]